MLINSSIAIACGPFLDRDIMHSMDICISDVTDHMDDSWSPLVLPILEAQCEASLHRHPERMYSPAIAKALNCPNDCFNHGDCLQDECICHSGFTGHDCNIRTKMAINPALTKILCK